MTKDTADVFARDWIDSFNRRDFAAVLAHFSQDAVFTSQRAMAICGCETLLSRDAIGKYWKAALDGIGTLHFTFGRAIFDPSARSLVIVYTAEIDGVRKHASEFLEFDETGVVVRGEAMNGASITTP